MRILFSIAALLSALNAWGSATTTKQIDSMHNSSGGSSLSVPSTGSTLDTDSNTLTLTNKTLSSTTDVLGGVTMTLGSDATGDMYYRNSLGVLTRLPVCTGSQVIGNSGGIPACVTPSGGGTWTQETPSGTCNGSTTSFTLANTPTANAVVQLSLDGSVLRQGSGKDYTISGSTITLGTACATGQLLWAIYTH